MAMSVKQLIEALSQYPDDMEVHTEGCDCYGEANSVGRESIYGDGSDDVVMIYRGILEDREEADKRYKEYREAQEREAAKQGARGLIA